jgi:hypothetical protein
MKEWAHAFPLGGICVINCVYYSQKYSTLCATIPPVNTTNPNVVFAYIRDKFIQKSVVLEIFLTILVVKLAKTS